MVATHSVRSEVLNKALLESFYKENFSSLCKKWTRRAGSYENAEDCIQEAFTRALKYLPSYTRTEDEFGAWMNSIINRCVKQIKKDVFFYEPIEENEDAVESDELEDVFLGNEKLKALHDQIMARKQPTKDILYMKFIKGYTPFEIGQVLDMNAKAISMTIYRFRKEVIDKDAKSG